MPTKSPRRLPTDNLLYSNSYSTAHILQHLTVGRCENGICRVLLVSDRGWASPLCGPRPWHRACVILSASAMFCCLRGKLLMPRILGITGNIACGKTAVGKMLL